MMLPELAPVLAIPLAVLLDALLGEARRWHPLAGFGALAQRLELALNRQRGTARLAGILALLLLLAPFTLLAGWLAEVPVFGTLFGILALYFAIGQRSLAEHAGAVAQALAAGDLPAARALVGRMVSRETAGLDEEAVARATVESVLENGNDAVFGALFWFALAGAPGAVLYRLANTLDAMWGYRNARYSNFGWAVARFDDLLNYLPARLTALTYALLGATRQALICWRSQAPLWDSPNAGPVMAAGAGALQVELGGAARYGGEWQQRPVLGCGAAPAAADIERALKLVRHGVWLWLGVIVLMGAAFHA